MSRFGEDNTDIWDADDWCPSCHNAIGNCACAEPSRCLYCGGALHRWPDWSPYCSPQCSINAETESVA